jgi:hypothetical protein
MWEGARAHQVVPVRLKGGVSRSVPRRLARPATARARWSLGRCSNEQADSPVN